MTIEEAKEYLYATYYSIESENGVKYIHISGDWCPAPEEYAEKGLPYRNCEYTWLYIPLEEFIKRRYEENFISDRMSEVKQYEGEYDEQYFINSAEWMSTQTKLSFADIRMDTPCGDYVG